MHAPYPPAALALLDLYIGLLLERNEQVNLTGAAGPAAAQDILLTPSLAVSLAWDRDEAPTTAVDIGSGNGFPGVVVAALWRTCRVTLVERRGKKARAIGECLAAAGFDNAEAVACDARELKNERPALMDASDLVTVRAVGSLALGTRLAGPLLAPGGMVVHWKRQNQVITEGPEAAEVAEHFDLHRLPDVAHGDDGVLVRYQRALR